MKSPPDPPKLMEHDTQSRSKTSPGTHKDEEGWEESWPRRQRRRKAAQETPKTHQMEPEVGHRHPKEEQKGVLRKAHTVTGVRRETRRGHRQRVSMKTPIFTTLLEGPRAPQNPPNRTPKPRKLLPKRPHSLPRHARVEPQAAGPKPCIQKRGKSGPSTPLSRDFGLDVFFEPLFSYM